MDYRFRTNVRDMTKQQRVPFARMHSIKSILGDYERHARKWGHMVYWQG